MYHHPMWARAFLKKTEHAIYTVYCQAGRNRSLPLVAAATCTSLADCTIGNKYCIILCYAPPRVIKERQYVFRQAIKLLATKRHQDTMVSLLEQAKKH
jgi:hypothetical protein